MTQNIEITWLGHSTFRIDTAGKTIVIDPWVNANPMCPEKNKKFEKLDLMLCTHGTETISATRCR